MPEKYTVSVDFDGVIHSYTTPWIAPHVIPDPPVEGAVRWLLETLQDFDVVIHSARARTWRGRRAIRAYLRKAAGFIDGPCAFDVIKVSNVKVPALVYVDDRAWRFDGKNWPSKSEIHMARPWNRERANA